MNYAEISCSRLYDNISSIKRSLPSDCKMGAVIKGDGYGHGITEMAVALDKCSNIYMLIVSSFEEAMVVCRCLVRKPILILNRVSADHIDRLLQLMEEEERHRAIQQLIFSAYRSEDIHFFQKLSQKYRHGFSIHIRLDFLSGMRGMNRKQIADFFANPDITDNVNICGLYAHVYSVYRNGADAERNVVEYRNFFSSLSPSLKKKLLVHLLSSYACFRYPGAVFDMVRVGANMYGLPVEYDPCYASPPPVKPILSITAKVINVTEICPGSQVDYEGYLPAYIRRVALISVGEWDIPGFFLSKHETEDMGKYPISNSYTERCVRIRGHLCHLAGSPCMDTLCVDVTDFPDISVGDTVRILGDEDGIRLEDWLHRTGLGYGNCQMLFSGMARISKHLAD